MRALRCTCFGGLVLSAMAITPAPAEDSFAVPRADAIVTYGWLLYEFGLMDAVSVKFPDLAPKAADARAHFQQRFGAAIDHVTGAMAQDDPDMASKLALANQAGLAKETAAMDRAKAEQDVADFAGWSEGRIRAQVLETLSYWQFKDQPERELKDGFVKHYAATAEDPKAQGLGIAFDYPASWKLRPDAETPKQLAVMNSEDGAGIATLTLAVTAIASENARKLAHTADAERIDFLRNFLPKDAKIISTAAVSEAGYPATAIVFQSPQTSDDQRKVLVRLMITAVFTEHRQVFMGTGITLPAVQAGEMDRDWSLYAPLFKQMLAGVTITDAK
jgi:hypothetical protein